MADAMPDAGSFRDAVAFLVHFFRLVLPPVLIPLCAVLVPVLLIGYVRDVIQRRKVAEIERKLKNRLCVRCGYDLRESVGRCPECGEKITVN